MPNTLAVHISLRRRTDFDAQLVEPPMKEDVRKIQVIAGGRKSACWRDVAGTPRGFREIAATHWAAVAHRVSQR